MTAFPARPESIQTDTLKSFFIITFFLDKKSIFSLFGKILKKRLLGRILLLKQEHTEYQIMKSIKKFHVYKLFSPEFWR